MNIVSINSGNFGSTGNIMIGISQVAKKYGHKCYTACPDGRSMRNKKLDDHIFIGNILERNLHLKFGYYTGFQGCGSALETWRFLKKINEIQPDIIHLHNLHNCYINLPMLFHYIKKHQIRIIWTLHVCWAFSGQCSHFTIIRCERWKTGCYKCPQYKIQYPPSNVDQTKTMWQLKKQWFTGVADMTIVVPSQWLADLVGQSYLKDYPVRIINNGIDLNVFKPTSNDFRKKHDINNKFILLGVAFGWEKRKGLDVFIELSKKIGKDFQVVLVGTDDKTDQLLPDNIISIHHTNNQKELAEIYTVADVFVNPTREENYPTVNMEAIACGTPVITFRTGGSPEILNSLTGSVIECDDIVELEKEIKNVCYKKDFLLENFLKRASSFNREERFKEYVELYEGKYNDIYQTNCYEE